MATPARATTTTTTTATGTKFFIATSERCRGESHGFRDAGVVPVQLPVGDRSDRFLARGEARLPVGYVADVLVELPLHFIAKGQLAPKLGKGGIAKARLSVLDALARLPFLERALKLGSLKLDKEHCCQFDSHERQRPKRVASALYGAKPQEHATGNHEQAGEKTHPAHERRQVVRLPVRPEGDGDDGERQGNTHRKRCNPAPEVVFDGGEEVFSQSGRDRYRDDRGHDQLEEPVD